MGLLIIWHHSAAMSTVIQSVNIHSTLSVCSPAKKTMWDHHKHNYPLHMPGYPPVYIVLSAVNKTSESHSVSALAQEANLGRVHSHR